MKNSMLEEVSKDSNIKSTIETIAGLVKAIPVYDDAIQPAAKQIGQSLETITKTVNIALAPIKALVWGYEQIELWITASVATKLKHVKSEDIISPPPNVAGPAIEALRYVGFDDQLRELYANLLAAAMDKKTVSQAHPAYVEVLKNLSSGEAMILQVYKSTSVVPALQIKSISDDGLTVLQKRFHTQVDQLIDPELIPSYLDNLIRLGILEVPMGTELAYQDEYKILETDKTLDPLLANIVDHNNQVYFERMIVRLTNFGAQFIQQVVTSKA
jgi:hypothetical protein